MKEEVFAYGVKTRYGYRTFDTYEEAEEFKNGIQQYYKKPLTVEKRVWVDGRAWKPAKDTTPSWTERYRKSMSNVKTTEGGGRMGRKKLTVHRRGYTAYKDVKPGPGVKMKHVKVPPTTYKIEDRGAPGRGKKVIKIKHPGRLTEVGYNVRDPAEKRHRALARAVSKYGERSTVGMLHAQAVFRKRTDGLRPRFASDRTWVAKSYGTYYGRRSRSGGRGRGLVSELVK